MQFRKGHGELSVIEAVDNLSNMAELDLSIPKKKQSLKSAPKTRSANICKCSPGAIPLTTPITGSGSKTPFAPSSSTCKSCTKKTKGSCAMSKRSGGIQALMVLAGEAAQKIDKFFTDIFKGEKEGESVTELKEFKELQHFYLTQGGPGGSNDYGDRGKMAGRSGEQVGLKSLRMSAPGFGQFRENRSLSARPGRIAM